jgi:hypothetical protein
MICGMTSWHANERAERRQMVLERADSLRHLLRGLSGSVGSLER